ncbi:MFS transporter [Microbacterium resistens]|uniref:MFS transporter n=1 Tax=Microbacterium resistens TaxID=156977 RepID=UPI00082AAFCF|nr:MFS transporter [Microbacterium resistens]
MNTPQTTGLPIAGSRARSVVGFLIFCELASGFTQGFYPPLLKDFALHLGVSDADITWFLTLQTLAAAVCVPLLSKLGDIFGHRRILRIAIVSVLIGTLITALVPSYPVVLAGRLLVGPLAVWLPLEIALVHNRITGDQARKAIGLLVTFLTGGAILGTFAAGGISAISPNISVTMLAPVVLVLISAYAVFFKVPESANRTSTRIDYLGFAGIAVFMIAALIGLRFAGSGGFLSAPTLVALGVAVLAFALWVMWELRTPTPAVDVRLVVSRRVGPIYLAALCFGMVMFGGQAPMSTFLGSRPDVEGYGFAATPGLISLVVGSVTILATVGAALFSLLAARIGIRTVLLSGAALSAVGNLLVIPLHTSLGGYLVAAIVQGLGYGLLLGALPARLAELAPADATGIAAGVYNSLRTLGGSLAGAIFAALLGAAVVAGTAYASVEGYIAIWVFSGAAFVVCFVALIFLPREERSPVPATTPASAH